MRGATIKLRSFRTRYLLIIFAAALLAAGFYFAWQELMPQPKLDPGPPGEQYAYYIVIDETNNQVLMYVSSIKVSVGDELITDDSKWYTVVKVERNIAYARFNAEKTRQQQK